VNSNDHKKNLSDTQKKRFKSPEVRLAWSNKMKELWKNKKLREKRSKTMQKVGKNKKFKENCRNGQLKRFKNIVGVGWKGGGISYWTRVLKPKNKKCWICGETENLEIHHVDRNRKNNSIENFMIVCRDCHIYVLHTDMPEKISLTKKKNYTPEKHPMWKGGNSISYKWKLKKKRLEEIK